MAGRLPGRSVTASGAARARLGDLSALITDRLSGIRVVQGFAREDAEHAPQPGGVVFVGSSSIRLWATLAERAVSRAMDLTPRGIREHLDLCRPIYRRTAAYGHFGRKPEGDLFPWERTDLVDALKKAL